MSGQHDKECYSVPVDVDSSIATSALISSEAPSFAGSAASPEMETRGPQLRTTAVLSMTFILERLDEQILTAVYTPIGKSLHASPSQLGSLTLCRALVQALVSPLSGLLGDNCNRIHIVAAGTLLWGAMTAAIGLSTTLAQAMAWSAFNGIGLALVLPCVQSLVADYYVPAVRGRAFGFLFTMAALGGMAGGFFATSISAKQPGGIEGWRFAFYIVAALAAVAAVVNLLLGIDPRPRCAYARGRPQSGPTGRLAAAAAAAERACRALGRSLRAVLRIRTFQVLVLQGVVGGMPWTAMGYFTMWLQLLGFSNVPAAALTALFWGGTALGNLIGGAAGDALVKVLPDSGRQLTCQMSIATGLPLAGVLLRALPVRDGSGGSMDSLAPAYALVMFVMGTLVSWPQTHNSAMFSEVVPEGLRSSVYAFDRCFEGALSALSAPLVGLIAERWFGYTSDWGDPSPARQLSNAHALGNGLLVCLVVPWGLQFLFYTLLYRAFPRDRDASAELRERQRRPRSASMDNILAANPAAPHGQSTEYLPEEGNAPASQANKDIGKQIAAGTRAHV